MLLPIYYVYTCICCVPILFKILQYLFEKISYILIFKYLVIIYCFYCFLKMSNFNELNIVNTLL